MGPQINDEQLNELEAASKTENSFGTDIEKARRQGRLMVAVAIGLVILGMLLLLAGEILVGIVLNAFGLPIGVMGWTSSKSEYDLKMFEISLLQRGELSENQKAVCRECLGEVSLKVKRCPHCGWKPKKRGALYWTGTGFLSLSPLGPILAAKGASDNLKAKRGVSKVVDDEEPSGNGEIAQSETGSPDTESDVADTLARLHELKQVGAITDEEFEVKKKELLDRL